MVIKALKGIGDAVYTFPIIKHYCDIEAVTVITPYPIVFDALNVKTTIDYSVKADLHPEYTSRRASRKNQYEDMLESIGLSSLPFEFKWELGFTDEFKSKYLVDIIMAMSAGKKRLCVIKEPCAAHMHKRARDFSVAPRRQEMQSWIDANKGFVFVSVGQDEEYRSRMEGIDFDFTNKTSVQDLISLCSIADIVATQIGHLIPIAQGLRKPLVIFYPENITDKRLRHLGPHKVEM